MQPFPMGGSAFGPSALPPVPQESDEEILLRNFLQTGQTSMPAPQPGDAWDEEDWKIAALSGDPMGVREVFDKTAAEASEEEFIKNLAGIDWNAEDAAANLTRLIGENPRGLTKQSASLMDVFRDLGETKKPDLSGVAKFGSGALKKYREILAATGDPDAAMAAVADVAMASEAQGDGKPWTDRYSGKEADAIRSVASGARLEDFQTEYAQVVKDGYKGTPDQYVKEFKGFPDLKSFAEFKRKQGIASLSRDYQIPQREVEALIGSPAVEEAPVVAPKVVTPVVQPVAPVVPSAPTVVPVVSQVPDELPKPYADQLKDLEEKLSSSKGFEKLSLLKQKNELKAKTEREEERAKQLAEEKKEQEVIVERDRKMTEAFEKVLSKVDNVDAIKAAALATGARGAFVRQLGFEPKDTAFTTSDGEKVLWNEVASRLFMTPEVQAIVSGAAPAPAMAKKPSNPVNIKAIRKKE